MKTCSKCGETKEIENYPFKGNCCKICVAAYSKIWRKKNKEAIKASGKKYREENKEAIKVHTKKYREENKEAIKASGKKYYMTNKEKIAHAHKLWYEENKEAATAQRKIYKSNNKEFLAIGRKRHYEKNKKRVNAQSKAYYEAHKEEAAARGKIYRAKNKDLLAAKSAKRKAGKLMAAPSWLTSEHHIQIKEKYTLCATLTESTGINHHVDHIVPLNGKNVCGLHVPWNLQVITAEKNIRKNNNYKGKDRWK